METSGENQQTDIKFNQGVAAKISNLIYGYIKNDGFIDNSLSSEGFNKDEASIKLSRARSQQAKKMQDSQKNYIQILNAKRQLKNFEMLNAQLNQKNEL